MANIHGLHSNRRDSGSDNDDNEDGNNRYVGGVDSRGGGSGLAVMPNTDDGDGNDASSSIFRQAGEATADDGPIRRTITMYRDGFTVDSGPYRRLDDPNNSEFLTSLARGITPRELRGEGGENVTVGLVDKRGEDYDPDAAAAAASGSGSSGGGGFQSFTGTGNSLGTASTSGGTGGGGETGNGIFVPDASATAPTLNPSNAATSIQIRLLNGKRLVVKVNLDATVSSLGEHIDASGDGGGEPYVLSSGFPPRTITDLGQSIEEAGLKGAQVMQKKA